MTSYTKPIMTFGHYQLVYRSNDDLNRLDRLENRESSAPFGLTGLKMLAGFGVFMAATRLLIAHLDVGEFSLPMILLLLVGILGFLRFCQRSIFSLFKIIDTQNHTPKLSAQTTSSAELACLMILATLSSLQLYARQFGENISKINEMILSLPVDMLLVALGIDYFTYDLWRLLRQ